MEEGDVWRTWGWRRAMEEAAGKSPEDPKVKNLYAQADKILADAIAPDKLKDNPFKGKPLNLEPDNPFDKDFAMANRMLKSAGYKPTWIEAKEEILGEKRALRQAMDQHLNWLEHAAGARSSGRSRTAELKVYHDAFLETLRERIEKLHRRILRFNLEVPVIDQQVVNIRFETFTKEMREAAQILLASIL